MLTKTLTYHVAQISSLLNMAGTHVEQLVLVSGGTWETRTGLLQAAASEFGLKYADIGLPLAKELLNQSPTNRTLFLSGMIEKLVHEANQGLALDKIEILFDPELHIDPFQFVCNLSHGHLILLAWPGIYESSRLIYAEPDHPEYRVYQTSDTIVYALENAT